MFGEKTRPDRFGLSLCAQTHQTAMSGNTDIRPVVGYTNTTEQRCQCQLSIISPSSVHTASVFKYYAPCVFSFCPTTDRHANKTQNTKHRTGLLHPRSGSRPDNVHSAPAQCKLCGPLTLCALHSPSVSGFRPDIVGTPLTLSVRVSPGTMEHVCATLSHSPSPSHLPGRCLVCVECSIVCALHTTLSASVGVFCLNIACTCTPLHCWYPDSIG
jgi:hypothetical protein